MSGGSWAGWSASVCCTSTLNPWIFLKIWRKREEGGRNFGTSLASSPLSSEVLGLSHITSVHGFSCCWPCHTALPTMLSNWNHWIWMDSQEILPPLTSRYHKLYLSGWHRWHFFPPQVSPFVIWSDNRFVLGTFRKGQIAGKCPNHFVICPCWFQYQNTGLLLLVTEHQVQRDPLPLPSAIALSPLP